MTVYYNGIKIWGKEPGEIGYTMVEKTEEISEEMKETNTYNFPNPCSNETVIRFSVKEPTEVKIIVYNINGTVVYERNLNTEEIRRGVNYIKWDLTDNTGEKIPNGIYVYKIKTGDKAIVKKMVIIR